MLRTRTPKPKGGGLDRDIKNEFDNVAKEEIGRNTKMLTLNTKLALKNAQQVRLLLGAMIPTYKGDTVNPLVQTMLTATKIFADRTRGKSGHNLGTMDAFVLGALARTVAANTEPEAQALLTSFLEHNPPGAEGLIAVTRVCRVEKMYNRDHKRVLLLLSPEAAAVQNHLVTALTRSGVVRMWGAPPPAGLERDLQSMLDVE